MGSDSTSVVAKRHLLRCKDHNKNGESYRHGGSATITWKGPVGSSGGAASSSLACLRTSSRRYAPATLPPLRRSRDDKSHQQTAGQELEDQFRLGP